MMPNRIPSVAKYPSDAKMNGTSGALPWRSVCPSSDFDFHSIHARGDGLRNG
jgi:hypothetical protein